MLPYVSYLRVYEPLRALAPAVQAELADGLETNGDLAFTWLAEQRTALSRAVSSGGLVVEPDQLAGSYVLRRGGHSYYCPADVPLRSWLSLSSLVEEVGATARMWFSADTLASADADFVRWRQDHPRAVPHIRQTTWGIPRTWFVLVVEDEREMYDAGGHASVRYRASIEDARRRLVRAAAILRKLIDETELLDELDDLMSWLEEFDDGSWVELDYANVARLLGEGLAADASARNIHEALAGLRRGDFASAGASYRAFEDRWRVVNSYERAN